MPSPAAARCSAQDWAISARIWSPSISSPCLVGQHQPVGVAVQRDAEMRAVLDDLRADVSGTVEPQPRLMLKPSGATPTGITSAPSSHSTVGATR